MTTKATEILMQIQESDADDKLPLLVEYFETLAEETTDIPTKERYMAEVFNCKYELGLVESEELDFDPIVEGYHKIVNHGGEQYLITTHGVMSGTAESSDIKKVKISTTKKNELGMSEPHEDGEFGSPLRIRAAKLKFVDSPSGGDYHQVEGGVHNFHVYLGKDGSANIRSINGNEGADDEHKEVLIKHLSGNRLIKDALDDGGLEKYDAWKNEVEKHYPEHKGKFKYKYHSDADHISAEIHGVDRSFGVFDMKKNEGHVLTEWWARDEDPANTPEVKELYQTFRTADEGLKQFVKDKYSPEHGYPSHPDHPDHEEYKKMFDDVSEKNEAFHALAHSLRHAANMKASVTEATAVVSADRRETASGHEVPVHRVEFKSEEDAEKEENSEEEKEDGVVVENLAMRDGKWALVSKTNPDKVLQYYQGEGKPSLAWINKVEKRVAMFESADDTRVSIIRSLHDLEEGFESGFGDAMNAILNRKIDNAIQAMKIEIAKNI